MKCEGCERAAFSNGRTHGHSLVVMRAMQGNMEVRTRVVAMEATMQIEGA